MYEKLRAIVLGTVRHSDRVNIVTLYTDRRGRIPVVVPAGGTSRAARARRAQLMPLSVIETDLNFHADRTMQSLGRFSLIRPNTGICGNPVKSAIALFMAEFLGRSLRDDEPDAPLWQFLDTSVATLDSTPAPANFHIAFMSMYARFAGIMPDVSGYTPFAVFDMREGLYADHIPLHPDYLRPPEAAMPYTLSRLTYGNYRRWRIPVETRRRILRGLIAYYSIHLPGIDRMRSIDILRQLFA